MSRDITRKDVVAIYDKILQNAERKIEYGDYDYSLKCIEAAASWAYKFNVFFSDVKAEILIKKIADKTIGKKQIKTKENRFILLDTAGLDNRGLTQQYIRALEANKLDYLFVTLRSDISPLRDTIDEVHNSVYGQVMTFESSRLTYLEKAVCVREAIISFQARNILLHLMPWDVISLIAIYTIKGIQSYNINLTDHAFWLGSSFIDYNIDFRPYGKTISLQKRSIVKESILELPYYPIKPVSTSFSGLPSVPNDSVIIFTGGAPYKMDDKKNTFFNTIIDGILDISPKVVIFVAGYSSISDIFKLKISNMRNKERVYNIGIRKDIDEVYRHCDIYLQTYPLYGGLMAQYGVMHKLPVLAYVDKDKKSGCEEITNHFGQAAKCFVDFSCFIDYAKQLINDEKYRKAEGEKLYKVMMNENLFNEKFKEVVLYKRVLFNWSTSEIDYDAHSNMYLMQENTQGHKAIKYLINMFSETGCLKLFTQQWLLFYPYINKRNIIHHYKTKLYSLFS